MSDRMHYSFLYLIACAVIKSRQKELPVKLHGFFLMFDFDLKPVRIVETNHGFYMETIFRSLFFYFLEET